MGSLPPPDAWVIAIDGPAASGKSTVSRRVAAALDALYVDSGALYRGVTWAALEKGFAGTESQAVLQVMHDSRFTFYIRDGAVVFAIDGYQPVAELRTEAVNRHVSPVAAMPDVRVQVVAWLRDMVRFGGLVMEGRDIGTKVFPAARHKFYLDASPDERARRRHGETRGAASVTDIRSSISRRDDIDSRRQIDPRKVAPDAVSIDSTQLSIDDVVAFILARVSGDCGPDA
jgi:cytidylate kinase